jgi:RING finger/CHY zinc finger protein 1
MNDEIRNIQRDASLSAQEKSAKIQAILIEVNKRNNRNNRNYITISAKCEHYDRKCKIYTLCCKKIYGCRLCHDAVEDHQLNRFETETIICSICDQKQGISNQCIQCHIQFADYFCKICRLWTKSMQTYHCDGCGICNVGEKDDNFHCDSCKRCYLKSSTTHTCNEIQEDSKCTICYENLFQSTQSTIAPNCGHTIHFTCYENNLKNGNYQCPFCKKCLVNMTSYWQHLDNLILTQPMPEEYEKKVNIGCNDCGRKSSNVDSHFLGNKCSFCNGYNCYLI